MDHNSSLTPFPSSQSHLAPLHTKVAGAFSHLHHTISHLMQVLDVFNSFPVSVEAAAAVGLIDGVKPKLTPHASSPITPVAKLLLPSKPHLVCPPR